MEGYSFFSLLARMKNIDRWGLMRSSRRENLTEHCFETAAIAHALAIIGNKYFGKEYDAEHILCLAMYHDICEVYTGDLPTPVKYFNDEMRESYRKIESASAQKLLSKLPCELRDEYRDLVTQTADSDSLALVKAADKISALIKCTEEINCGNPEFRTAYESTKKAVEALPSQEAAYFCKSFLPAYGLTLDEM